MNPEVPWRDYDLGDLDASYDVQDVLEGTQVGLEGSRQVDPGGVFDKLVGLWADPHYLVGVFVKVEAGDLMKHCSCC